MKRPRDRVVIKVEEREDGKCDIRVTDPSWRRPQDRMRYEHIGAPISLAQAKVEASRLGDMARREAGVIK